MRKQDKPLVIHVLGGPGSGKGTQCKRIHKQFGFVHLSAGDLLREERDTQSEIAEQINSDIQNGRIVEAEITIALLKKAMISHGWAKNQFVIDGFPRDLDNLDKWIKIMGDDIDLRFLLYIDCSFEIMQKRILQRSLDREEMHQKTRIDDNIQSIKKRFQTYKKDTVPVIQKFKDRKKLQEVDGTGTLLEISTQIQKIFKSQGMSLVI